MEIGISFEKKADKNMLKTKIKNKIKNIKNNKQLRKKERNYKKIREVGEIIKNNYLNYLNLMV